jgi:hypothetical protein
MSTLPYPTLKEVEDCTSVEQCLRWNRFLPSPRTETQLTTINAVVTKLTALKRHDNTAYTRASRNIGWDHP